MDTFTKDLLDAARKCVDAHTSGNFHLDYVDTLKLALDHYDAHQKDPRRELVVEMAEEAYRDEEHNIDPEAIVSEGENGAYVQAWVWVGYDGTALDKDAPKGMFNILSPDGIAIHPEGWETLDEALQAKSNYVKSFEAQGYWHSTKYGRMSLDLLKKCLELEFYPDEE